MCWRNERDWSKVTLRLQTKEEIVIEQPSRSTDGQNELGELVRISLVLSSLSFNLITVIQDLS